MYKWQQQAHGQVMRSCAVSIFAEGIGSAPLHGAMFTAATDWRPNRPR